MSVIRSSKTFSTQSAFGSSSLGSSAGMVINGLGSSGVSLSFAGQKYGSSGGNGVRISRSMSTSSLVMPAYEVTLYANEKQTMQNLNDRLASYLERVRTLEHANMKLELQIKEFHDNKNPLKSKDMSGYFVTISELCTQIHHCIVQNADLRLKLDNTRIAADNFQIKYETEMNLHMVVDADLLRLQGVIGEIKLSVGDLENQLTGLKDELLYIKKNHEENLHLLREQQSGSVNVEIDCTARSDLDKELQEMRAQYETLIEKKRREAEEWFHSKAEVLQTQVTTSCTEIKTSQTELTDLKRTFQSLEIELQGLLKMKHQLEQSVTDVGLCYAAQLSQLQLRIDYLEEELQKLNANMQYQASEYQLLLDIKMRLEMEIAEYRRLLDGEARATVINTSESSVTSTETVTKTVEIKEEEEHNPHVQRRVKVIVEELVDGQVVSTSVDEKLQEVN
ncbi:keratin, type I cytoskeletal 47 kDa-like isoform X1 [Myxocyprinus asiaticus]|uniref:keratin, type I cytoskeletal 47 kDa-like isoform X1 n=1 Tax=Myxocyprinus asiaticus TaxID=70543 RepID=UPI0022226404|nr:keratin, type I cytoskeletal 47 kDa-like isoform X1 [Myxocyprinus asiaticus]